MSLDVPTLMLAGAFVALLSGLLLVFSWFQYKQMVPALWWASGNIVLAMGIAALAFGGVTGSIPLTATAFFALTVAPMLIWTAARLFEGRMPNYVVMAAGPFAMAVIAFLPPAVPLEVVAGLASTTFSVAYLGHAAWIIGRSDARLASRWPLVGFLMLHIGALLLGPVTAMQGISGLALAPLTSLFGIIHFESLIFVIGTTIFVVAGMREASELRHKQAAEIDPLTGLANRRAFLERADRIVERCMHEDSPFAVMVIDLDRFKAVNDGYGHAMGDAVLRLFADVVRRSIRPTDVFGRLGGEEFAAVLPGTAAEAGVAIAERIRRSFEMAAMYVDGRRVNATLCAGVSASGHDTVVLSNMLREADAALYRAKAAGRNCVQGPARPESGNVVRVA
jgi:diguanylate cyclase (GGDEF)-like protein